MNAPADCEIARLAAAIVGGDRAARLRLITALWRYLVAEERIVRPPPGDCDRSRRARWVATVDALRRLQSAGIGRFQKIP